VACAALQPDPPAAGPAPTPDSEDLRVVKRRKRRAEDVSEDDGEDEDGEDPSRPILNRLRRKTHREVVPDSRRSAARRSARVDAAQAAVRRFIDDEASGDEDGDVSENEDWCTEDEAFIAMDIRAIVEDMGHAVTNVARTRDEAIQLARRDPPDLILADIQLADKSSGIDAVNHILKEMGELPIVFITAFPERLLTGERPEPAFLITKPYTEEQVQSAVSQAMFFASTDTLRA
jgi:CheY-like chemotaxis protein